MKPSFLLIAILIPVFTILAGQLNSPCIKDEATCFYDPACSIIESGIPFMYFGEGFHRIFAGNPQGYQYLISLIPSFTNTSVASVRAVNLLTGLLLTLTLFYLFMHFFKNQSKSAAAALLITLNPYVNKTVMMLDPDCSILGFLSVLLLFTVLKEMHYAASLVFVLMILMKLTQPVLIAPFVVLLFLIKTRNIKRSLILSVSVFGAAFLASGILFYLYESFSDIPFWLNIAYFKEKTVDEHSRLSVLDIISHLRRFFIYAGPYSAFLIFAGIIQAWINKKNWNTKKYQEKVVIFAAGIAPFILYIVKRPTAFDYYKYEFSAFLLLLSGALLFLLDTVSFNSRTVTLYTLTLTGYFLFFGDIILSNISAPLRGNNSLMFALNPLNSSFYAPGGTVWYLLPLICMFFSRFKKNAALFLIASCIGSFAAVSLYQYNADYSLYYYYGENGFSETLEYLKKNYTDREVICRNDIGIAFKKRFYNIASLRDIRIKDSLHPSIFVEVNSKILHHPRIHCVCTNEYPAPTTIEILNKITDAGFVKTRQFGDFTLYER